MPRISPKVRLALSVNALILTALQHCLNCGKHAALMLLLSDWWLLFVGLKRYKALAFLTVLAQPLQDDLTVWHLTIINECIATGLAEYFLSVNRRKNLFLEVSNCCVMVSLPV